MIKMIEGNKKEGFDEVNMKTPTSGLNDEIINEEGEESKRSFKTSSELVSDSIPTDEGKGTEHRQLQNERKGNITFNEERGGEKRGEDKRTLNNPSQLVVGKIATTNSHNNNNNNNQWQVSKLPTTHLFEYEDDVDLVGKLSAYLTNSEEFLGVLREIKDVVEHKKALKATIFLFLIRHKVIYRRLFGRYFETMNHGSLIFCINDLLNKHFIYKIENGSSPHEKERKDIENALRHSTKTNNHNLNKIVWYGITEEAQGILPPFLKAFLPIIPDDTRKRIMDSTLKTTFSHTHVQLKNAELLERRDYNYKYQRLVDTLSKIKHNSVRHALDINKSILREAEALNEDKMDVAKRMLRELKEGK